MRAAICGGLRYLQGMATAPEIIRDMGPDRLRALIDEAPRKIREELFRSAGIRTKGSAFSLKEQGKQARVDKLVAALGQGKEPSFEACEELIRNYLARRPELLGDALDFFEVPHQGGMTDAEIGFMEELAADRVQALRRDLESRHDAADVGLYLKYMKVPVDAEGG